MDRRTSTHANLNRQEWACENGKFRDRDIFLPDVLLAARAMQVGVDLLKPLLARDGLPVAGRVVIGTVHGDLHDMGKNLVGSMLR